MPQDSIELYEDGVLISTDYVDISADEVEERAAHETIRANMVLGRAWTLAECEAVNRAIVVRQLKNLRA